MCGSVESCPEPCEFRLWRGDFLDFRWLADMERASDDHRFAALYSEALSTNYKLLHGNKLKLELCLSFLLKRAGSLLRAALLLRPYVATIRQPWQ